MADRALSAAFAGTPATGQHLTANSALRMTATDYDEHMAHDTADDTTMRRDGQLDSELQRLPVTIVRVRYARHRPCRPIDLHQDRLIGPQTVQARAFEASGLVYGVPVSGLGAALDDSGCRYDRSWTTPRPVVLLAGVPVPRSAGRLLGADAIVGFGVARGGAGERVLLHPAPACA